MFLISSFNFNSRTNCCKPLFCPEGLLSSRDSSFLHSQTRRCMFPQQKPNTLVEIILVSMIDTNAFTHGKVENAIPAYNCLIEPFITYKIRQRCN